MPSFLNRLLANDPLKQMISDLGPLSPEPSQWPEISAYLAAGRQPASAQAKAAIRAYLDLRESLGGLAAFRAGGRLDHQSLQGPCRRFLQGYHGPAGLGADQAAAWSRFCLAADHLLARACEARVHKGRSGRKMAQDLADLLALTREQYLDPLAAETRRTRPSQAAPQPEPGRAGAALAARPA